MARALGIALSGPRSYGGAMTDDPFVNAAGRREIGAADVERAVGALWRVWAVLLAMAVVVGG